VAFGSSRCSQFSSVFSVLKAAAAKASAKQSTEAFSFRSVTAFRKRPDECPFSGFSASPCRESRTNGAAALGFPLRSPRLSGGLWVFPALSFSGCSPCLEIPNGAVDLGFSSVLSAFLGVLCVESGCSRGERKAIHRGFFFPGVTTFTSLASDRMSARSPRSLRLSGGVWVFLALSFSRCSLCLEQAAARPSTSHRPRLPGLCGGIFLLCLLGEQPSRPSQFTGWMSRTAMVLESVLRTPVSFTFSPAYFSAST